MREAIIKSFPTCIQMILLYKSDTVIIDSQQCGIQERFLTPGFWEIFDKLTDEGKWIIEARRNRE